MKKITLIKRLIVILIFSGCGQRTGSNQSGQTLLDSTQSAKSMNAASLCKDGSRESDPNHLINLVDASEYLWSFYSHYKDFTKNKGAFSEISKEDIRSSSFVDMADHAESPDSINFHCGLLLYFYQSKGLFCLAIKNVSNLPYPARYFPVPSPEATERYNLTRCVNFFPADDFASQAELMSFITAYSERCEATLEDVGEDDININTLEFINQFGSSTDEDNPAIGPLAFFHLQEINLVLDQENCEGLRFFWGYSNSEKKIKVIVLGIDRDGKNILESSAKILERSWPPI